MKYCVIFFVYKRKILFYSKNNFFQKARIEKVKIDQVNYWTFPKERTQLIEEADLIFYVCATGSEIELVEQGIMKIGQNIYQHEFNKLHFVPRYKNKCAHVTLNNKLLRKYKLEKANTVGDVMFDKVNCLKLHKQTKELVKKILECTTTPTTKSDSVPIDVAEGKDEMQKSSGAVSILDRFGLKFSRRLAKWFALKFLLARLNFMYYANFICWPAMRAVLSLQELIGLNEQPLILEGVKEDESEHGAASEKEEEESSQMEFKCDETEKLIFKSEN
jgi:hypothetical protein